MHYSLNLLKKFISCSTPVSEIANALTLKVCEIEHIKQRLLPDNVIIGKTINVERHPNADKLFVCQINCGKKGNYQIITGGENIKANVFVAVALPGTHLPAIDLTIDTRPMRGVESQGMICSKGELGINEDQEHHRIWILHDPLDSNSDCPDITDQDVGVPLKQKFPWLENTLFEIDNKTITHRPDLTGHFGLAYEIQSIVDHRQILFSHTKKWQENYQHTAIKNFIDNAQSSTRTVSVQTDGCRAYCAIDIHSIKTAPSHFMTRVMMYDAGLQPKLNWIDFSNIFMHIAGHPIHCFDADTIQGTLTVRDARDGEQFTDLFGTTHSLNSNDIVIADDHSILALAGIIGGQHSGVSNTTTNIVIELANFDPVRIRKTGTRLNLRTEAELRFEKNINPLYTLATLQLLMDEIKYFSKDLGSLTFAGIQSIIDKQTHHHLTTPTIISLDCVKTTQRIFGYDDKNFHNKAEQILQHLGMQTIKKSDMLDVIVPIRRSPQDCTYDQDLYEEIVRIYGYEKIPTAPLSQQAKYVAYSPLPLMTRKIEEIIIHQLRYHQVETYPRVHEEALKNFGIDTNHLLTLQNSLAPELTHLRDSMYYNMIDYIQKNKPFFDEMSLYDTGNTRQRDGENHHEIPIASGAIYHKEPKNRQQDPFLKAKGDIDFLIKTITTHKPTYKSDTKYGFHPKKYTTVWLDDVYLGRVGEIHPQQAQYYKIELPSRVVVYELQINALIDCYKKNNDQASTGRSYQTLKDQIVTRDLAFLLDEQDSFEALLTLLQQNTEINNVKVFDIYKGPHIPQGKKSIAISFDIYGDGTMSSDQINRIMNTIIEQAKTVNAHLR